MSNTFCASHPHFFFLFWRGKILKGKFSNVYIAQGEGEVKIAHIENETFNKFAKGDDSGRKIVFWMGEEDKVRRKASCHFSSFLLSLSNFAVGAKDHL